MKWINKTSVVYNGKDLNESIKQRYGLIEIKGDYAEKAYSKYSRDTKLKTASLAVFLGGFVFLPLAGVGLLGNALTTDFSKYTMVTVEETRIVLELKKKYKK